MGFEPLPCLVPRVCSLICFNCGLLNFQVLCKASYFPEFLGSYVPSLLYPSHQGPPAPRLAPDPRTQARPRPAEAGWPGSLSWEARGLEGVPELAGRCPKDLNGVRCLGTGISWVLLPSGLCAGVWDRGCSGTSRPDAGRSRPSQGRSWGCM